MPHTSPYWAVAGLILGLILLVPGVMERGQPELSDSVLAVVNERPLQAATYKQVIEGIESEKKRPLSAEEREEILNRIIEEDLIVQHGVTLGLVDTEPRVRRALINAVYAFIDAGAAVSIDEAELRRFYAENPRYFAAGERYRVRQLVSADADSIVEAQRRLGAGETWEHVERELSLSGAGPIPDTLLPVHSLARYLGRAGLELIRQTPVGSYSPSVYTNGKHRLYRVEDAQFPDLRPFEEVRNLVERQYLRVRSEERLRRYLDSLREEAHVEINEDLLRR